MYDPAIAVENFRQNCPAGLSEDLHNFSSFPDHGDTSPSSDSHAAGERSEPSNPPDSGCRTAKGKAVDRGRTLGRSPRICDPLAKAESRLRSRTIESTIEVDVRAMEKRSRSNTLAEWAGDESDPKATFDDDLLEPCPPVPIFERVEEVLDSAAETRPHKRVKTDSTVCMSASSDPRSRAVSMTISDFGHRSLYTPPSFSIGTSLEALENQANKSSSSLSVSPSNGRHDNRDLLDTQPISTASKLPTEILQQIYRNLPAVDFNSARHTCRSWFISSLHRSLLETMLKRGGWYASSQRDLARNHVLDMQGTVNVNDEWLMSKRISRECALGAGWRGVGLREDSSDSVRNNTSAFLHGATIDFTEVAIHFPGANATGTIFTVSSCGKFLLAANGCLVYIYELNKRQDSDGLTIHQAGSLRPITSIIVCTCPLPPTFSGQALGVCEAWCEFLIQIADCSVL